MPTAFLAWLSANVGGGGAWGAGWEWRWAQGQTSTNIASSSKKPSGPGLRLVLPKLTTCFPNPPRPCSEVSVNTLLDGPGALVCISKVDS